MVARRKNGLEVHSSRLQPYPGHNHHWKSLKSYLNGFKLYAIGIMGVSLELPLSNFNLLQVCLNTAAVLTPRHPSHLQADQNPHYTIEATMDPFTYLRHK